MPDTAPSMKLTFEGGVPTGGISPALEIKLAIGTDGRASICSAGCR
jgi:hypothetical protein